MNKIASLAILVLLVPLIVSAVPQVSLDGFCDNFRQVHLINFPYSPNGEYVYLRDTNGNQYNSYSLTSPNTTVIAQYNAITVHFLDNNGNDIVTPVALPDCGSEFGHLKIDMSQYCNPSNYPIYVESNFTTITAQNTGQYNYVLLAFDDINGPGTNWIGGTYATGDTYPIYVWNYATTLRFSLLHYNYYLGYLPLASKIVTNISCNISSEVLGVDTSDFCNNFRSVKVLLAPGQQVNYEPVEFPGYTQSVYNPYSTTMWIDAQIYYHTSNSDWRFWVSGRFQNAYNPQVHSVPLLSSCTGNYGPFIIDSSSYCGNGWAVNITNPTRTQNSDNFYVNVRRSGETSIFTSFYLPSQSSTFVNLPPGDYVLNTPNGYTYVIANNTNSYSDSSHQLISTLACPTQYGNIVVDTSNFCQTGQVSVNVTSYTYVDLSLSFPGAPESSPLNHYIDTQYNYGYAATTLHFNIPAAGYYSSHLYNYYGNSYPIGRYDFTVPVCTTQSAAAAQVDLTNYCTNFRVYNIDVPAGTVYFLFNSADLTKVLHIYPSLSSSTTTYSATAYAYGIYSLISFNGNIPNPSSILSRTDIDFTSCGEEYGPVSPVIDSSNFCANLKRVTITYPGYSNIEFSVYFQNTTFIGKTNPSTGTISLPNPGQYMIIYGSLDNPGARHFFTTSVGTCPTEFGTLTIDYTGYCNNHKKLSILIPAGVQYFFYSNFDAQPYSYYASVSNFGSQAAYQVFELPPFQSSSTVYTVVSWNNNNPNDQTNTGFITSRKDFTGTNIQCPTFFGPEYIVPSCDLFGGSLNIGGVVPNSQYFLYMVNDPLDDITNMSPVNQYYVNQQSQLQITVPSSSFYILAARNQNNNNDVVSKLFVDGTSANSNGSTSFYFPSSVFQGEVAYAEVSLSGLPAYCLTEKTLCKFGTVVIEATVSNTNVLRCQVPLLPVGTYSVSFSTDKGITFKTNCRSLQVKQDTSIVAFDYKEFDFDSPTEAYMVWDRVSTAALGLNYVKIEAFKYSLLNVSGNAQILILEKEAVLFNRSMNIGYFKWDTALYDLSFLALQISFGNSYNNYKKRAVAYVQCRWSYCGRRSFCAKYGYSQPTGVSAAALNPFDQACKSHAICSADATLCPSYCDELLTSMLTSVLYGREQANPFALSAPQSSTFSVSDVKWAQKAVISFSKAVSVTYRETPTTAPVSCPAAPILSSTITTMACGDPHYTIGNMVYDMQLPGEFLYFSGYLKRSSNNLFVGSSNFGIASAPTVILTQQRPIVTSPHYISILTAVSVTTRQAPHSSIIVTTQNGLQLFHDGVLITALPGCVYYFVGGSVVFQSEYQVTVVLDDGIELSMSGGWGSICLSMTISGVFENTTGFFGGVTANGNNLQGKCRNGTTETVFTVTQGVLVSENLPLGRCWKLSGADNLFEFYNLGLNLKRDYDLIETKVKPRLDYKRNAECDSIPNALLAEMCNADLPYLPDVPAADIAALSTSTAETYNLATGVSLYPTLKIVSEDVVLVLNVSLENWNLTSRPLQIFVETRFASSADLQSFTNWENYEIFPQDYNADPIVTSTVFYPATNCTTYSIRAQAVSLSNNYSSPWISVSLATDGSCFSAIIENVAIIESNNLPDPTNFTEIAPSDPDPVTTNAITVGAMPTSDALTSSPVTSKSVTSRSVTSKQLTSAAITSSEITSGRDLTTAAVTSAAVTSASVTSSPVTSAAVTSSPVTSSPLSSSRITSSAITSHSLTTDFSSVAARCATYSFTDQGYFCSADQKGFYQCLSGPFASQSKYRPCASGTFCRCATGVDCATAGICTR